MDVISEDCRSILERIDCGPLRGRRVLVTGANGLIGQYLVAALHQANKEKNLGAKIAAVSLHAPNDFLKGLGSGIEFRQIDLSNNFSLEDEFDYIFHAAGYGQPAKFIDDPFSTVAINVNATRILLEAAKKTNATFAFMSSAEVYGEIPEQAGGIDEEYRGSIDTTNPRAVYAESKRLGEALLAAYARLHGIRAKILRISHLYGPGISIHDTRVLGDFLHKAFTKKKITLLDEGRAVKTFGYVADAITMILFVALHGRTMVYHVGGRDSVSIRSLAEKVGAATGAAVEIPGHKADVSHIGVDPKFVGLNLEKVIGEMGGFTFTPLEEGLRRTIVWNRETFHLS